MDVDDANGAAAAGAAATEADRVDGQTRAAAGTDANAVCAELVQLVQLALQGCIGVGVLPEGQYPQPAVVPLSVKQRKKLQQQAAPAPTASAPSEAAGQRTPPAAAAAPAVPDYTCPVALAAAGTASKAGKGAYDAAELAGQICSRLDAERMGALQATASASKGHINFCVQQGGAGGRSTVQGAAAKVACAAAAGAAEKKEQHQQSCSSGSRDSSRQEQVQGELPIELGPKRARQQQQQGDQPAATAEQPAAAAGAAAGSPRRLELVLVPSSQVLADKVMLRQEFELYKRYQVGSRGSW
jgi:hypothetical protein